jgi:hypothetical protein
VRGNAEEAEHRSQAVAEQRDVNTVGIVDDGADSSRNVVVAVRLQCVERFDLVGYTPIDEVDSVAVVDETFD